MVDTVLSVFPVEYLGGQKHSRTKHRRRLRSEHRFVMRTRSHWKKQDHTRRQDRCDDNKTTSMKHSEVPLFANELKMMTFD
jgi:hypothetical protein